MLEDNMALQEELREEEYGDKETEEGVLNTVASKQRNEQLHVRRLFWNVLN